MTDRGAVHVESAASSALLSWVAFDVMYGRLMRLTVSDVASGAAVRLVAILVLAGCSRVPGGAQPGSERDGSFAPEEIALVRCAERFVLENGYTVDPAAADVAHFKREVTDQGSTEEILAQRRGKLVPGAATFCPKRLEASAHVNFRYRAPQAQTGLRVGRAVSVTANCDDATMSHKDAALFDRLDPATGCRPIL